MEEGGSVMKTYQFINFLLHTLVVLVLKLRQTVHCYDNIELLHTKMYLIKYYIRCAFSKAYLTKLLLAY